MKRLLLNLHPALTYNPHHPYFWKEAEFGQRLRERGYELVLEAPLETVDWVIFFDATSVGRWKVSLESKLRLAAKLILKRHNDGFHDLYAEAIEKGMRKKLVLMLHEGEVPTPENFSPKLHAMFDTVLTWHDGLVDNRKFFLFRLPTAIPWPKVEPVPFARKKLLTCILSNYYTRRPTCLGPMRRAAVRYFEARWPDQFDLFGNKWNQPVTLTQRLLPSTVPRYPSYRGYLDEGAKAETLKNYRFSLCYENCAAQPGWISNRIFDCMRSDNVPIFLGGNNIDKLVDTDAFIDRRQFGSDRALGDFIEGVSETDYQRYREAMARFLAGPRFVPFKTTSLADTIVDVLERRGQ